MPAKSKKVSGGDKSRDVQETEEKLQAVVLADSYETRFRPFTLERPRCLLPLVNSPLIEYTFEFLAGAGVQEVFVYCGAHTEQVEEYIQKSKWSRSASPFQIQVIRSESKSIGDAMRDLDKRSIMKGDFVVVYGDVVSNIPLDAALAAHRARRATDNNAIMTMVLREAGSASRNKSIGNIPVFVVDPSKNRCLHYEQLSHDHKNLELDAEILTGNQDLDLRPDLIDCGIDICTPDVLALWSDNFDYEAPRKGFLHSVLKDYELNGKTIHTHIVDEHYGARVRDLLSYDSVSRDVLARWAYPLSPENNLHEGHTYRLHKGDVFKEENVKIAKSSIIGRRSVLGSGTSVGDRSTIRHSVIGRNCSIGNDCVIDGAYIWEDVVIGDGSHVKNSLVASGSTLGQSCTLSSGALISYNVKTTANTVLEGHRRITTAKRKRGEETASSVGNVAGHDTSGQEYEASDSEDEDTAAGLITPLYSKRFSSSTDSISTLNSDLSEDEYQTHHHDRAGAGSFISVASDDSHADAQRATGFHNDAAGSIYDSLQKGHDVATIQLELQGLRMSANASEHQLRRAVVVGMTKHIADSRKSGQPIKQILTTNKMLIERTIFDHDDKDKKDQVDFLLLAQTEFSKKADGDTMLLSLCNDLYLLDVLEEEGFEQWWADERSSASEEMRKVRGKTEQFMKALAEAESESEEDDDDDEDEDDESDE